MSFTSVNQKFFSIGSILVDAFLLSAAITSTQISKGMMGTLFFCGSFLVTKLVEI